MDQQQLLVPIDPYTVIWNIMQVNGDQQLFGYKILWKSTVAVSHFIT